MTLNPWFYAFTFWELCSQLCTTTPTTEGRDLEWRQDHLGKGWGWDLWSRGLLSSTFPH